MGFYKFLSGFYKVFTFFIGFTSSGQNYEKLRETRKTGWRFRTSSRQDRQDRQAANSIREPSTKKNPGTVPDFKPRGREEEG